MARVSLSPCPRAGHPLQLMAYNHFHTNTKDWSVSAITITASEEYCSCAPPRALLPPAPQEMGASEGLL